MVMEEEPHCQDLLGNLSEFIDGTLRAELCVELEQHLAGCKNCRIVVDTLRKTIDLYQQPDDDLPEPVRQRLYHTLRLDDFLKKM
jgi:hypothetical protein